MERSNAMITASVMPLLLPEFVDAGQFQARHYRRWFPPENSPSEIAPPHALRMQCGAD